MTPEELFLRTWTIYISFYTVFLTVNLAALGVVVEKISDAGSRRMVVIAFGAQNMISFCTAIGMSLFSVNVAPAGSLYDPSSLPPLHALGLWGGVANAVSHLLIAILWFCIMKPSASQQGSRSEPQGSNEVLIHAGAMPFFWREPVAEPGSDRHRARPAD